MRRRTFLASTTALLSVPLAGCAHPDVVLDFEAATAEDIADQVSTSPDPTSEAARVVTSAAENGTATRRGRDELFDPNETVRVETGVYEVTENRANATDVTVYGLMVDTNTTDTNSTGSEIAFEDLPEFDRERLDPVLTDHGPSDQDGFDIGVDYGTEAEVANKSVLVPESQYDVVVRDGDPYRVGVDTRTDEEWQYAYEVREVAPDLQAFVERVRERYLFELTGLSDAERDVVAEAIDGAYFQDDDAFRSVVEQIRSHEGVDVSEFYGTWLLTDEGTEYVAYVEW